MRDPVRWFAFDLEPQLNLLPNASPAWFDLQVFIEVSVVTALLHIGLDYFDGYVNNCDLYCQGSIIWNRKTETLHSM